MTFLSNFPVDVAHQLRAGHLLNPMPEAMRDDPQPSWIRLHAYVPGWDIPAMGRDQKTHHYGLVGDLLAQWWRPAGVRTATSAYGQRIATFQHFVARPRRRAAVEDCRWTAQASIPDLILLSTARH